MKTNPVTAADFGSAKISSILLKITPPVHGVKRTCYENASC